MKTSLTIVITGLVVLAGCDGDLGAPISTGESAAVVQNTTDALSANGGRALARLRCPSDLPAALNPPADATLKSVMAARGVQIYTCAVPAAGGAPAFVLKAPHAVLSEAFDLAAIHFAGPSWQAVDGSLVTATRLAAAPAPDPTAIPWLLLQAATHVGTGSFDDITIIQRLDTVGGVAPATGCDDTHLGAEVLVPYRADYFFYHAAAAGGRSHQCAAQ